MTYNKRLLVSMGYATGTVIIIIAIIFGFIYVPEITTAGVAIVITIGILTFVFYKYLYKHLEKKDNGE